MLKLAGLATIALMASAQADVGRLASAESFIIKLYAPYLASADLPAFKLDDPKIASPSLLALMQHSRAGIEGPGGIDGDPLCNCQSGPVRSVVVQGQLDDGDHATVKADFQAQGQDRTQIFTLVRGPASWRLDDISYQGQSKSLREELAFDNAESDRALAARAGKTPFSLQRVNGRWSSGDCHLRFYVYRITGGKIRFEDQSGKFDIERISDIGADRFTGTTLSSTSGEPVGSKWTYIFSGNQVRITGPTPSQPIVQTRCG